MMPARSARRGEFAHHEVSFGSFDLHYGDAYDPLGPVACDTWFLIRSMTRRKAIADSMVTNYLYNALWKKGDN
jgi:hypothetical protein